MASLTPGVLSKLLANKDSKVTGDHRSALLQIIEILPAGDDPWRSCGGFFLKVSDSLHSAYVSVSDSDSDMVYAGEIQLGQFVYAARLDSGSPVPVLRGMKLVPTTKRKPCACVGNPVELVSSDLLFAKKQTISSSSKKMISKKKKSSENENGGVKMKKNGDGNGEGFETRRLSLDSAKRACWDQKKPAKGNDSAALRFMPKRHSVSVVSDKEAPHKTIPFLKHPNSNISPLKNKKDGLSPLSIKKTLKKESKSSCSECTTPSCLVKVPLASKTGPGQKIAWDMLPLTITELGKQAVHHQNVTFLAAVRLLEEASAADGVIHCMCIFAELCESSQKSSAGALVQKFLDLNRRMQSAAMNVNSLLNLGLPGADSTIYSPRQNLSPDVRKDSASKNNASSWVKAAIATNLSAFDLFRKQDKDEFSIGEKCHFVILENSRAEDFENRSPASKQNKRNNGTLLSDLSTKLSPPSSGRVSSAAKRSSTEREDSSKKGRLKEAASLAKKLLLTSREWFLKYLEDSLKSRFGLKREERSPEAASLLGQLRKVNHWLDELASSGAREDKRIEGLKKNLYRFLLEHVDSALVTGQ